MEKGGYRPTELLQNFTSIDRTPRKRGLEIASAPPGLSLSLHAPSHWQQGGVRDVRQEAESPHMADAVIEVTTSMLKQNI